MQNSRIGLSESIAKAGASTRCVCLGLMMELPMRKMAMSAAAVALLAAGLTTPVSAADTVTAVQVAKAPVLAAGAADPAWAKAKSLTVPLSGEVNFKNGKGATTATLKAVYSGDMLYVLLQYE